MPKGRRYGSLADILTSPRHGALRGHDMSIFRLVYASTSLLSDEPDLACEQIEQILLVSRRNNEVAEITGALLFSDTNFSQVLEGPRAEVERLYGPLTTTRATRTCSFS